MGPMAKAIVSTVKPKAKETPSRPMPTFGIAAANTALPHPPRTNQKVPKNSAPYVFIILSFALLIVIPNVLLNRAGQEPYPKACVVSRCRLEQVVRLLHFSLCSLRQ